MAKGESWSELEVAATVSDYMEMLNFELAGQAYNKTSHRKSLLQKLDGRSEAAVELKHQNISAVLRDLGCVWIPGYKPRSNYQEALANFVERWINTHPEFDEVSKAAVEKPAFVPSAIDFSKLIVDAPRSSGEIKETHVSFGVASIASKRDYVAREARNVALGNAGEQLVLEYEEFRLRKLGKKKLAERVEHVSLTKGDGLGYDILSFEENGRERYIEVKTTAFAKETPFYASCNEVAFSNEVSEQFNLYRLFEFRKSPKLFTLPGDIQRHCKLDPVSFICCF